ncbi:hypothetical protein SRHO_G00189320 [Serrasalmus rhombeus]
MLAARSLSRAELSEVASQRRIERRSGVLDQSDPGGRVEVAALCSARSLRRSRALFKLSDRYELLTVTRSQHQQQRVYRLYSPVKPPPNGRYRLYGAARDPETFLSSTHTKRGFFSSAGSSGAPAGITGLQGAEFALKAALWSRSTHLNVKSQSCRSAGERTEKDPSAAVQQKGGRSSSRFGGLALKYGLGTPPSVHSGH